ncbi:hypothetical protein ABIB25_005110 [Nakamurella sp. UYEF19]|uniref:FtsX-like permease family protein n=1 Tax=Nakamurella sp. UYEF19 TaxID=1756392 RepID=UPI003392A0B3
MPTRQPLEQVPATSVRAAGDHPGVALGWALSMAVADRRNVFRMLAMALGVALCAFVLLALASIEPSLHARNVRVAPSLPLYSQTGPIQLLDTTLTIDGQVVTGELVHIAGATTAVPPGISRLPSPGELLLSPALQARMSDPTFRAVLTGTVVGTIDPGVLPGRDDLYFYQGSGPLTESQTISGWGGTAGDATLLPSVWSLLITGAAVLMVPLLLFVAMAGRIGAARRDRRSATLRLLGASISRLRLLVAGEALIAAVVGVTLAVGAYGASRLLVDVVRIGGRGMQVADVRPTAVWGIVILIGVPVLAVAAALFGFRQSAVGPLGVLGRERRGPRLGWRLALFGLTAVVTGWAGWREGGTPDYGYTVDRTVEMCVVVALTLFSVAALVGLLTDRLARWWPRGSISGLLARQRIVQDGASTTRAAAAIATVLAGFVTLMTMLSASNFDTVQARQNAASVQSGWLLSLTPAEWSRVDTSLHSVPGVRSATLVTGLGGSATGERPNLTVANCDAIRLMTVASGCRDGDVFRVDDAAAGPLPAAPYLIQFNLGAQQSWTPPAGLQVTTAPRSMTTATGGVLESNFPFFSTADFFLTPEAAAREFPAEMASSQSVQVSVDLPGSSVSRAQEALSWLGSRAYTLFSLSTLSQASNSAVPWVRAGLLGAGALTLLICALGQWLMASEQIRERRRAFAIARASGVPLGVLVRSVLHAVLMPVVVGVVVAVVVGTVLAEVVQYLRHDGFVAPIGGWIAVGTASALVIALLIALGSAARLRSTTGPAALRTE